MRCPFCGSYHVIAAKRGYSWLYGCLGFFVLSIFGFILGFIGKDKLTYECEDCGEKWSS